MLNPSSACPFYDSSRVGVVEIKLTDSENLKFLIDGGFADIMISCFITERSFDLVKSSKEDFIRLLMM